MAFVMGLGMGNHAGGCRQFTACVLGHHRRTRGGVTACALMTKPCKALLSAQVRCSLLLLLLCRLRHHPAVVCRDREAGSHWRPRLLQCCVHAVLCGSTAHALPAFCSSDVTIHRRALACLCTVVQVHQYASCWHCCRRLSARCWPDTLAWYSQPALTRSCAAAIRASNAFVVMNVCVCRVCRSHNVFSACQLLTFAPDRRSRRLPGLTRS